MADRADSYENLKSIYLTKIRYLDEQLDRYQLKCYKLEEESNDLTSQHHDQKMAWRSICDRLKLYQDAKGKEKDELEERLASQKQALTREKEGLKLQHIQQMTALREQIHELHSKSMNLDIKYEEEKKPMRELEALQMETAPLVDELAREKEEQNAAIQNKIQELQVKSEMLNEKLQEAARARRRGEANNIQHLKKEFVMLQELTEQISKDQGHSELNDLREYVSQVTQEFSRRKGITWHKNNIKQVIQKLCEMDIRIKYMNKEEQRLRSDLELLPEQTPLKPTLLPSPDDEIQMNRIRSRMAEDIIQDAVIIIRHIQTDSSNTRWKMSRLLILFESASTIAATDSCC